MLTKKNECKMKNTDIEIIPTLTVHELLEAYPDLENVLIGIAPPFKKLKNPILRKTITKVATIRHVAAVGGISLNELISRLRETVGQQPISMVFVDEGYFSDRPDWFSIDKVVLSVDESKAENKDEMTLVTILKKSKKVKPGEIIELVTTFLPAPGIATLQSKGYSVYVKKEEGETIKSYFLKPDDIAF
jgi:hypothetical protein